MTLTLTLDTFSATLTQFLASNGYERTVIAPGGEVEYSLDGTPIVDGQLYEPKFVWTLGALVTQAQYRQLKLIYRRSERKRAADQDFAIAVADYVENYFEDQTGRTRALAPGGTVISIDGEGLEYPALFHVRLYEPKFERTGNALHPYIARCVLRELDTVPA
jgi:hypothetical protein